MLLHRSGPLQNKDNNKNISRWWQKQLDWLQTLQTAPKSRSRSVPLPSSPSWLAPTAVQVAVGGGPTRQPFPRWPHPPRLHPPRLNLTSKARPAQPVVKVTIDPDRCLPAASSANATPAAVRGARAMHAAFQMGLGPPAEGAAPLAEGAAPPAEGADEAAPLAEGAAPPAVPAASGAPPAEGTAAPPVVPAAADGDEDEEDDGDEDEDEDVENPGEPLFNPGRGRFFCSPDKENNAFFIF